MSDRLYELVTRIFCVAVAAAVVAWTTIALVAAAADAPAAAGETAIHYNNMLLDAVAAPNYAAVIVFGTIFFVIGLMRTRARAKARTRFRRTD